MEDIQATKAIVIANIDSPYPMKNGVMVYNMEGFLALNLQQENEES